MSKRKHHLLDTVLKIPKTDFPSLGSGTKAQVSKAAPPLLLLQLPEKLSISDLTKSNFVMHDDSDKCRLVCEDQGVTFDLVRVETSNSYVLVKDGKDEGTDIEKNSENGDGKKKETEARLLRENNTFFLECNESRMDLESALEEILKPFVYPTNGISFSKICEKLMHSKKEVKDALDRTHALKISNDDEDAKYGILSEEIEIDVWYVIRRVLSEWDGGADYANGVVLDEMIKEILKLNDGTGDDVDECVLRNCLEKCTLSTNNNKTQLDVNYIARIVAHHVFTMQSAPWEKEEFVVQWHSYMPGVGSEYQPSLDIIKDLALVEKEIQAQEAHDIETFEKDESKQYLKYFPRTSLPKTIERRFKALFKERAKWKLEDLVPYVDDLVEASNYKTVQELLAQHTKVAPRDEDDEEDVEYYVAQ